MRRAGGDGDARLLRVVRIPAGAIEYRRWERVHEVVGGHARRRDLLVHARGHVCRLRPDPRGGHL